MTHPNLSSKILSFLFLLGFLTISNLALAKTDSWNGTVLRPYEGSGAIDNPYMINTAEEFAFLLQNYDYNSGVCIHKYYKLTCDIDMSACTWSYGIAGTDNKSFRAHFDGDGHKISNLKVIIRNSFTEIHAGVFPQLGGDADFESVIENLEIDNITFEFANANHNGNRNYSIGGLVGQMYGNSRIENCIVNGMKFIDNGVKVTLPSNAKMMVGALVGDIQSKFGEKNSDSVDNAKIINSYGLAAADLGNVSGNKDNFYINLEQGSESLSSYKSRKWNKMQNDRYSFFPAYAKISEEPSDASGRHFKATILEGKGAKMRWTVDGKEHSSSSLECTVPFDVKDRCIAFELLDKNGKVIASDAKLINPADLKITISSTKNGNSYTLKSKIIGEGSNALANEFLYSWRDMTDGEKEVGHSATLTGARDGHTYLLVAYHRRWKFCCISNYYSFNHPIYVCPSGIDANQALIYTIDGKTSYAKGNDSNDGLSPEKAVLTLKKAYELLKSEKSGGNMIVIMGDYTQKVFNTHFNDNTNPSYFIKDKETIITGQYGNICNGKLLITSDSNAIDADTRFENLTIHGDNIQDGVTLMAQEHNLTMGYGILMENYAQIGNGKGLIDGSFAPNFSIFGGFSNPDDLNATHNNNTIRLLSGYYGRVIAGSGYDRVTKNTGNVTGSPRNPIRTNIVIDICNFKNPSSNTFDVAMVSAGQGSGSCYAVTNIDIKGTSRVGRVIGGNVGYGRKAWATKKNGSKSNRPSDSFFGQSTINIMGGNVNDIYGTNLGRSGKLINPEENVNDTIATYFYGKSVINISGGMVRNTIYAAGGGGVTGLALNNEHHTFDPYIPYNLNNGDVAYGSYANIKNKMPKVVVDKDSLIDLNKTSVTINISGNAYLRGSVYGGGHGFSNQVYASMASCQAGDLFGDSHINVLGGKVDGYIYGGGRGTTSYFDNNDLTGYPIINGKQQDKEYFSRLALVYGSTNIDISGGLVKGMVFSGGEGSYYRETSSSNPENLTSQMASVVGNTYLTVSGDAELNDYIFGGGNYGNVLRSSSDPETGSTYVNIKGGKIQNSIFGGGHGHVDRQHPERSIVADIEGDTHVSIDGGEFVWVPESSRYDSIRYYGIYGSGLTASIVHGNTYVEASRSLFSKEFFEKAGLTKWDYGKPWDKKYTICGGGFGEMTDVVGNANVTIDVKDAEDFDSSIFTRDNDNHNTESKPYQNFMDIFGGGLMGNVEGSTHVTIKGRPFIRNVYGGSLIGNVGLYDMSLNGDTYTPNNDERDYVTNTTVDFISGAVHNVFGGGLMGNICGETFVNIGSDDTLANRNIIIHTVYGGNDVTGTIAGSNNSNYGTNINIYGGTIYGDVYGSGNGQYGQYDQPSSEFDANSLQNASTGREHPHVGATKINISGQDENNRTRILGSLYIGGNNTTIGQFVKDTNNRPQFGLLRECLVPNSGSAKLNIGSHVTIENLVMGSNGANLLDYIPYFTTDGTNWVHGFENQEDFEHFCRTVDFSCVPQLTFNKDRSFNNVHVINDLRGERKEFNTEGEMDSEDVIIGNFVGGGFSGSMTADDIYTYTLPIGLTITGDIIGGSRNAHFKYVETQGDQVGAVREYIGGFLPYDTNISQYHRLQLNIFCKFAPIKKATDKAGNVFYTGSNIYGGCYDYGIIHGAASINMHSDMVGAEYSTPTELAALATQNIECCQIYGAGKGANTEVIGNTYVSLSGALLNGERSIPNALYVYGGSMEGRVIGKSNVICDFQVEGATPKDAVTHGIWGKAYGGGRMGDVLAESKLIPGLKAPAGVGTTVRVYSGQIQEVFGGARLANIEGGSLVEINDKGRDHFHTIISQVYGGNDISGQIGTSTYKNSAGEMVTTNTYVRINETPEFDQVYSGFPLIGELFAGGNGNYGVHSNGNTYLSGEIFSQDNNINLEGKQYPDVETTFLDITGGTIFSAFGGANSSSVKKASTILVNYSGEDSPAKFDRTASLDCFARGKEMMKHINIKDGYTEDNYLIKAKYSILRLYGGNNKTDMTIQPTWNLLSGHVGTIYGGCNQADVIYYNESEDRLINPQTSGNVGLALDLSHEGFRAENVFGGCRMGNVSASKLIDGKLVPVTFADNQYGTTVNVKAGRYGRIFGGNDVSGTIVNGTRIQIEGGTVDEVYGAGNGEYVYQYSPSVTEITECYSEADKFYYYQIPASAEFGGANASDFQKMEAIAAYRPNISKSFIEIAGGVVEGTRQMAYITKAIYGGGNCATVEKHGNESGKIRLDIGDYCVINNLYLGSNGEPHINKNYVSNILKYNNMGALSNTDSNNRTLLDHHMDAVTMHGLPLDFQFHRNYSNCYIGSFYMGGNRGSLSTHGSLDLSFPRSLKIFDKIVGGSDRADIVFSGNGDEADLNHLGGILWDGIGQQPVINLSVNSQFINADFNFDEQYKGQNYLVAKGTDLDEDTSARVYPGCYQSGKIEGEVNVEINE